MRPLISRVTDVPGRARALLELARRAGMTIGTEVRTVHACGRAWEAVDVGCDDNRPALRLLNLLADFYAGGLPGIYPHADPSVVRMAGDFARAADRARIAPFHREPFLARAIHRFVQDNVRFAEEHVETFRSPELTMQLASGDCDDHAVLVASIAKACGIPARIEGFGEGISHVCPVLERPGRYAETTIKVLDGARYGEHPYAAAERLNLRAQRTDLAS